MNFIAYETLLYRVTLKGTNTTWHPDGFIRWLLLRNPSVSLLVDCDPRPSITPSEEDCKAVLTMTPAYHKKVLFGTTSDLQHVLRLPREYPISKYP